MTEPWPTDKENQEIQIKCIYVTKTDEGERKKRAHEVRADTVENRTQTKVN